MRGYPVLVLTLCGVLFGEAAAAGPQHTRHPTHDPQHPTHDPQFHGHRTHGSTAALSVSPNGLTPTSTAAPGTSDATTTTATLPASTPQASTLAPVATHQISTGTVAPAGSVTSGAAQTSAPVFASSTVQPSPSVSLASSSAQTRAPPTVTSTTQSTTTTVPTTVTTVAQTTTTTTPTSPPTTTPDPRVNKTVCFEDVGCFDNYPPFNNAALELPVDPKVLRTGFWLYTRMNNTVYGYDDLNYTDPDTITQSNFDPKKLTKVIVHGFSNTGMTSWVQKFREVFLTKYDFNVLVVNWGRGASFPDYAQAVANTRLVGTQLKLILEIMMNEGLHLEDVHLIGHSLGAHTSGYCGRLLGGKIGRISGLDPADPSFTNKPLIVRLDKTDAQYVDATHSNVGQFGTPTPSGHVDFYLNGGKDQPGCPTGVIDTLFGKGDISKSVACSHGRSHDVYIESIVTKCPFTAYPCSSYGTFQKGKCLTCGTRGCIEFGYFCDQYHARGIFYLKTASKEPFCGYHYGIQLIAQSGVKETQGKLFVNLHGEWGSSGFIAVTGDDKLKPDAMIERVAISPKEVGDITEVEVKYVKHSGFWFGGGENSFALSSAKITSGENGATYLVCLRGLTLSHNVPVKRTISTRSSC